MDKRARRHEDPKFFENPLVPDAIDYQWPLAIPIAGLYYVATKSWRVLRN
jgi:hypothetical protein